MKILKRLFVGSMVLVLLTTSLLVTAGVNENNNISNVSYYEGNSLGRLNITHQPLLYRPLTYRGMTYEYSPPLDNPDYVYYFPEVNGEVYMNFTLEVKHFLNDAGTYWTKFIFPLKFRYTWINDVYISPPPGDGGDYFSLENKTVCNTESPVIYKVYLTENDQLRPLETNGENKTLNFWLYGGPAITPLSIVHSLLEGILNRNLLDKQPYDPIPIKIVPT